MENKSKDNQKLKKQVDFLVGLNETPKHEEKRWKKAIKIKFIIISMIIVGIPAVLVGLFIQEISSKITWIMFVTFLYFIILSCGFDKIDRRK